MEQKSNARGLEPLLSVDGVAKALQLSGRTVRRMIASGDLPVIRFGRAVRVRQLDLDAFIGRQMRGGGL
jgi:excisionase family DNA binding protein